MASKASAINFDDLLPAKQPGMFDDILAQPPPNDWKPVGADDWTPVGQQSAPGMFDDLIPKEQAPQGASFNDRFNAVNQLDAQPQNSAIGSLKALGSGVGQGAIGLAGLPGDLTNLGSKLYDYLEGAHSNQDIGPIADKFGSENIQHQIEQITGPFYHGQTPIERGLETIGGFVPAVIGGPESLGSKLLTRVVAPGLASEAAGQATKGTAYEPLARAAGAIIGGGAAGMAAGAKSLAAPTEAALQDAINGAGRGYNDPAIKSLQLTPAAGQDLGDQIKARLLAAKVDKFNGAPYYDIADRLSAPRFGPALTVDDLEAARQDAVAPPATATPADKRAGPVVKGVIDNYLNGNIPQSHVLAGDADAANAALTEARGNYAAMKRSEDISNALGRAENQAGSTYSGHNLDNATRQQLRPILNQKEGVSKVPAFQDYTDEEIAALKSAVNGGWYGNLVRSAGKTLGGGGGIGHLGAGLTGGIAAHEAGADPMTAIALGVGASLGGRGLNAYANRMAVARTNAVTNLLRSRSPLAARQAAIRGQPGIAANITPALAIQALAASRLSPQAASLIPNGQ